jgi:hypothetical protein
VSNTARHAVAPAVHSRMNQLGSSDRHRESPGCKPLLYVISVDGSTSSWLPVPNNRHRDWLSTAQRDGTALQCVFYLLIGQIPTYLGHADVTAWAEDASLRGRVARSQSRAGFGRVDKISHRRSPPVRPDRLETDVRLRKSEVLVRLTLGVFARPRVCCAPQSYR